MREIKTKKLILIGCAFVVGLIALTFTTTYAIFNYTRIGYRNSMSTAQITFTYSDDTLIDISNEFPLDSGITLQEIASQDNSHDGSLHITSHTTLEDGIKYNIYLLRGDAINNKIRLLDENIKFQFEPDFTSGNNGFTVLTNDYATATNLTFDQDGKALISTGLVKDTVSATTVDYNFHMWIDGGSMDISSTTKRMTLAEGNPSLAVNTAGTVTATRYMKNNPNNPTTETLYPAKTHQEAKTIYTTYEFSNGFYNIKFLVEAIEYVPPQPICRRATSLHTEECTNLVTSYYCYGDGYYSGGSEDTTTITYGNLGTAGSTPATGDAFDCNVDGTGYNKRFYYVSNYYDTVNKTFDNTTAVLIYSSNTIYDSTTNHVIDSYSGAAYHSNDNWHGPVEARANLPTTQEWSNIELKTTERKILACSNADCNGANDPVGTTGTNGNKTIEAFSYSGYAARLLTLKELKQAGCDTASGQSSLSTDGSLKACNFLFEGTNYADDSKATIGLWFETPRAIGTSQAWRVSTRRRYVDYDYTNNSYGVRPVIDVPMDRIEY